MAARSPSRRAEDGAILTSGQSNLFESQIRQIQRTRNHSFRWLTTRLAALAECGVENWLQYLQQRLLDQAICHRRDAELMPRAAGFVAHGFTRGFTMRLPRSPCSATPSMRFLLIGSRFTLHASFPHSAALMQLRFTSFAMTSLWRDLRPQECAHAGRTE